MEQLLYDCLKGSVNYDIYALKAPQNKDDNYAVYTTISDVKTNNLNGQCDLSNVRFQIDVYAKDYPTIKSISAEIQAKIIGCNTYHGLVIESQDINDSDYIGYRVTLDIKVWSK